MDNMAVEDNCVNAMSISPMPGQMQPYFGVARFTITAKITALRSSQAQKKIEPNVSL
jgi:hypothetical protein